LSQKKKTIENAPALVIITRINRLPDFETFENFSGAAGTQWKLFDFGLATQIFCSAANEYGYDTDILGIFDETKMKEILDIQDDQSVFALLTLEKKSEDRFVPIQKDEEILLKIRK